VTTANVAVDTAWRTPQFWLLWVVLWHERDRRHRRDWSGVAHDPGDLHRSVSPAVAASFVGLISLFNMIGRFFWASTSD